MSMVPRLWRVRDNRSVAKAMGRQGLVGVCVMMLLGCGADAAVPPRPVGGGPPDELPDEDAGVETDEPDAGFDDAQGSDQDRAVQLAEASRAADYLGAAAQLVSAFVAQRDTTLELETNGCTNLDYVSARLDAVTANTTTACAELTPSCESGNGLLTATFSNCPLGETGATLAGTIAVTVRRADVDENPVINVELRGQGITITAAETYGFAGTLIVSTGDLVHYALTATLDYDANELGFEGSLATEESDAGGLEGIALDGAGTLSGASASERLGSWTCGGSELSYALSGFHSAPGACRADAGTLTVTRDYACTSSVMDRTVEGAATVVDVVLYGESTPATDSVHVTTTVQVAEQQTETEADITLPGECAHSG
jgi:hypothetical protein